MVTGTCQLKTTGKVPTQQGYNYRELPGFARRTLSSKPEVFSLSLCPPSSTVVPKLARVALTLAGQLNKSGVFTLCLSEIPPGQLDSGSLLSSQNLVSCEIQQLLLLSPRNGCIFIMAHFPLAVHVLAMPSTLVC